MSDVPPPPPSNSSSSSTGRRRGSGSTDSAPLGIYVIAFLGGIVSLLAFLPILTLIGHGGGALLVGLVLFALNAAQLYVLVGLVGLKPWAWTWALVLYGLNAAIQLFSGEIIGFVVALVIVVYLFTKADYYER